MAMTGTLMEGKRGLIMGVANHMSLAWAIAQAVHAQGAALAFTYQGEALAKRVKPLAESVGSDFTLDCDVGDDASLDLAFAALADRWDSIDFLVHAIAFSDKEELKGRYVDTSFDNFQRTMNRAAVLMPNGGSLLTLTYYGAERSCRTTT
jgi:enoyl-[acyl-carrier protein] reductase I